MRQAVLSFSVIIIIKYVTFVMKGRFLNFVAVHWLSERPNFWFIWPEEQESVEEEKNEGKQILGKFAHHITGVFRQFLYKSSLSHVINRESCEIC